MQEMGKKKQSIFSMSALVRETTPVLIGSHISKQLVCSKHPREFATVHLWIWAVLLCSVSSFNPRLTP